MSAGGSTGARVREDKACAFCGRALAAGEGVLVELRVFMAPVLEAIGGWENHGATIVRACSEDCAASGVLAIDASVVVSRHALEERTARDLDDATREIARLRRELTKERREKLRYAARMIRYASSLLDDDQDVAKLRGAAALRFATTLATLAEHVR
jgi:hypothetical protein